MPLGSWCSIPSSVVRVRTRRARASAAEMIPSSLATTVDHRYPPMFVGDVYPERSPGASDAGMLSAGSPVSGSVMASRLCQVSAAQRCRRDRGTGAERPPASDGIPVAEVGDAAWAAGLSRKGAPQLALPLAVGRWGHGVV